jgi:hypothetical protein
VGSNARIGLSGRSHQEIAEASLGHPIVNVTDIERKTTFGIVRIVHTFYLDSIDENTDLWSYSDNADSVY